MSFPITERTRLRRRAKRACQDEAFIHEVIDEAYVCTLATVVDERPFAIPFAHVRLGNHVYVHGSPKNHILCVLAAGAEACLTVTLLDGLVLARSAFHHSMNYRSVVAFAPGEQVVDEALKLRVLDLLVDKLDPGRAARARAPNPSEMKATLVVGFELREVSGKRRTGGPVDDADDMQHPVWAGVIPSRQVLGAPIVAEDLLVEAPAPVPR